MTFFKRRKTHPDVRRHGRLLGYLHEGSIAENAGKRAVRNTGKEPLVMLCVQYNQSKPRSVNPSDGTILNEPVTW